MLNCCAVLINHCFCGTFRLCAVLGLIAVCTHFMRHSLKWRPRRDFQFLFLIVFMSIAFLFVLLATRSRRSLRALQVCCFSLVYCRFLSRTNLLINTKLFVSRSVSAALLSGTCLLDFEHSRIVCHPFKWTEPVTVQMTYFSSLFWHSFSWKIVKTPQTHTHKRKPSLVPNRWLFYRLAKCISGFRSPFHSFLSSSFHFFSCQLSRTEAKHSKNGSLPSIFQFFSQSVKSRI